MKRLTGRCRGVVQSRSGILRKLRVAETQRTDAGGANLACGERGGLGSTYLRRKLDGTGVTWLMSSTGLAWISLKRDTSLTCHCIARTRASVLDPFRSLMRRNVITKKKKNRLACLREEPDSDEGSTADEGALARGASGVRTGKPIFLQCLETKATWLHSYKKASPVLERPWLEKSPPPNFGQLTFERWCAALLPTF